MTESSSSSNKRIAKNTVMLYIRMLLSMIVGLYTSRVVLHILGVEDYGIYGVVGGVVGLLGFLNSSMSGATSRFLTYEIGRGNKERLEKTFSSALIVHCLIAVFVLIVAETIGLWYVCTNLNLPEERMTAALWAYQFSIISAMSNIIMVPYNSCIIAHEKMDVYAYFEILNVSLKLLIVYLLVIGNVDKLILYSGLMVIVSIVIMMVYRAYCVRHFSECHFYYLWEKEFIKPLLSFSGWNLFGNFGSIMGHQGTNLVINSFFGVAMNASASIALSVSGIVTQFASNAMTAFRPPIIKLYANQEIKDMQSLTLLALKIVLFLYTLVAVPVFVELDYVLSLWLVEVPVMTACFCRILLISIFFETMRYIIIIDLHASGKVKLVSAISGMFFSLSPAILYCLYSLEFPVHSSFYIIAVTNVLLLLINVAIAKHYIPMIDSWKYYMTILLIVILAAISLMLMLYIKLILEESFFSLCFIILFSVLVQSFFFFTFCLSHYQRKRVFSYLKAKYL